LKQKTVNRRINLIVIKFYFMKKIFSFMLRHKFVLAVIIILLVGGGYYYKKTNIPEESIFYVTTKVEKGILINSVSGTGQVSVLNQLEVKPKTSGEVVDVKIKNNQEVKEGETLFVLDTRDVLRNVSEARASLENAKLDLEELLAPVDDYTLLQSENSLSDANDSLIKLKISQKNEYDDSIEVIKKTEDDLENSYEDAYNDIVNTFLDLPDIMTGVYNILYSEDISKGELAVGTNSNNNVLRNNFVYENNSKRDEFGRYISQAENSYDLSNKEYQANLGYYQRTNRYSSKEDIRGLLNHTIEITKKIADVIKSESNMFDYWVDYRTGRNLKIYNKIPSYQSDLASYTSKTNSHLTALLKTARTMDEYKDDIEKNKRDLNEMEQNNPLDLAASERNVREKEEKLKDLRSGASDLDVKNKKLSIQQRQNSLIEAQQNYDDHFIKAPFDGIVAEVNINKGDGVSSGTAAINLITNQKIAEVELNEIDAARVKVNQKATLEFDAVEDLVITGKVVEIDSIGAVSQGVVSYNVKISYDVQDDRVKPGMSVSASIILELKRNVIIVPITAVKTVMGESYVETLINNEPQKKNIVVGISNDTMIEVVDGLIEGGNVITQTTSSGGASVTNGSSSFGGSSKPSSQDAMRAMKSLR
jgi:RND family efflux transporter MFP subunit